MRTVKEVSEITGISIRTLRYYDEIGLLKPTMLTEANYRLYDDETLEKLQQILFFRELEIPLSDIKSILENPNFDKIQLLGTQKFLLELKRNRLNGIIDLITNIMNGISTTNFEVFADDDIQKMIEQAIKRISEDDPPEQLNRFGSIEKYGEYVATVLKNEYIANGMIKGYGSQEKAMQAFISGVWDKTSRKEDEEKIYRQIIEAKNTKDEALEKQAIKMLEEHWKNIAKREDVRSALLKIADVYLQNDELISETDNRWGKGSSKFIGQAIQRYFGD
ncbi:MerR family transcriptional regulator [Geosporobacter ferrireducens]|uniref:MerR family transcriptional regulator n=1 Tax=Geosporobacter ferrireducens TaxID=1424294 RepID=UPI00139CFA56|nr:MerR family transcriptional regulator [Geosporobacter ferrireducens]MTI58165.1 MerR family transcriptional regulator [Geosporobacter ferrireducens]